MNTENLWRARYFGSLGFLLGMTGGGHLFKVPILAAVVALTVFGVCVYSSHRLEVEKKSTPHESQEGK